MSRNYKLSPDYFVILQRRFYFIVVPIVFIMLFGGIVLSLMRSKINIGAVIIIPILVIYMIFSLRKTLNQQKQRAASYRLNIESDAILKSQDNFEPIRITKDQISSILDYSSSCLIVKSENKQIIIPASLESFLEVRSILSQWHAIDIVESKNKQNVLAIYSTALFTLVAFTVFVLGKNKTLVVSVGSILIVILLSSVFLKHRTSQLDAKTKRNSWLVIVPVIAIAIRLYYLLVGQ